MIAPCEAAVGRGWLRSFRRGPDDVAARTYGPMRRHLLLLIMATFAGCGSVEDPVTTLPTTPPIITGTIVDPFEENIRLVVGSLVAPPGSCSGGDRLQVRLGKGKIMFRSGAPASAAELTDGRLVSVWSTQPILDSCPGIVSATTTVIEDERGAADPVPGRTYAVQLSDGATLPAPVLWRQRDGSCAPGTLEGATLTFLGNGQLELRVQRAGGSPPALIVTSYSQENPGAVTSPEFTGVAIARHDSLLVPLSPGNPLLCAPAGELRWLALLTPQTAAVVADLWLPVNGGEGSR